MTFIFGIETNDGIMTYARNFSKEDFSTYAGMEFIATLRDKEAYYCYADNTPFTNIGVWDTYEEAHDAYIKGCCDVINRYLDLRDILGNYFSKSETISFTLWGETNYYKVRGVYRIKNFRVEHCNGKFSMIATVDSVVIRETADNNNVSFIHVRKDYFNESIIEDFLNGKAERWEPTDINLQTLKNVVDGDVNKFFENFSKEDN